jgi:hypothetical protein
MRIKEYMGGGTQQKMQATGEEVKLARYKYEVIGVKKTNAHI